MADLMLRAYKAAIAMEPIVALEYYVLIKTYKAEFYRQVDYLETLPPFQALDLGALAVQTVSARGSISAGAANSLFDLQGNEFGQWRWFPYDIFMARIFLPAGVAKHQLKFLQLGIEHDIIYRDPLLVTTEFNTWEDERPAFEAMNYSDYVLAATRIIVMGYRFHTVKLDKDTEDKIKSGAIPCTTILCSGKA